MSNLNLFGPINNTGYGTHFFNWAKGMIYHLTQKGVNVTVIPRGQVRRPELALEHLAGLDAALIDAINRQADMTFDVTSIGLWHAHDMAQFCGKTRIGYTVWETTRLTEREKNHLCQMNWIAVPTEWHRDILVSECSGMDGNILVWHEGVDHTFYTPQVEKLGPFCQDGFTLVNVGKWERRKGQGVLIAALGDIARSRSQAITLLAAWDNPWMPFDKWMQEITRELGSNDFTKPMPVAYESGIYESQHVINRDVKIQIHTQLHNRDSVKQLYYAADAGIFPYFAEGWGLSAMEMMAMAKPIAATAWGAPLEYLHRGEYYPITTGQVAQAYDNQFFFGDKGEWFQVDVDAVHGAIIGMMDDEPQNLREVGRKAAQRIQQEFTWLESTRKVVEDLEEIGLV